MCIMHVYDFVYFSPSFKPAIKKQKESIYLNAFINLDLLI